MRHNYPYELIYNSILQLDVIILRFDEFYLFLIVGDILCVYKG